MVEISHHCEELEIASIQFSFKGFAVKESKDGSDILFVLCWVVKELDDRVEESIAGMIYE